MCIVCGTGDLVGYREIDCSGCQQVEIIPSIPGLVTLDCSNCPRLKEIGIMRDLRVLYARNCGMLLGLPVPRLKQLSVLDGTGSRWLTDAHVPAIKVIQRFWRRRSLCRGLEKRAEQIISLWWAPGAKGGYFWKRKFRDYVSGSRL